MCNVCNYTLHKIKILRRRMKMFQLSDIKEVQAVRPDLNDEQAGEILGWLCDVYSQESFTGENPKLFSAAADLIYPEVNHG